ncbi:hypothetical protein GCM10018966_051950 [Streptomyces yanii]
MAELVGDIGDLAPPDAVSASQGPAGRRLRPDPRRPALRGSVNARDIARTAGTGTDEALGKLYELHSLGFVERDGGWMCD